MDAPRPITDIDDPRWVRAISHPIRTRLLAMLKEQPASPVMLAEKFDQSLGVISYHVRTLYNLGLLDLVSTRQRRGATEHIYRARRHPRFSDKAWDRLDTVAKQRMITAALDQIHAYASQSAAAGGFDKADAHFTRNPLRLDLEGWRGLAKATKRWLREMEAIEKAAAKRLRREADGGFDVGLVILLFEAIPFTVADSTSSAGRQRRSRSSGGRKRAGRVKREHLG